MSSINSLETLLVAELRDLLDAETRITKAIPKMVKAADSEELRSALNKHLEQTEEQISRLEQVFTMLGMPVKAKTCPGMRGIIEEGNEHLEEKYGDPSISDAAIIGSAQKVEHYEIAAYGTAAAHAKILGNMQVAELLGRTLQEEKETDELLSRLAENFVNVEASEGETTGRNGTSTKPSSSSRSRKTASRRTTTARSRRQRA